MKNRVAQIAAFACVLFGVSLHAAGIEYWAPKADLIVVGSIETRLEGPTQVSFVINIDQVLKGSAPGQTINVVHPWVRAGMFSPPVFTATQEFYGIWFLTDSSTGNWDVLDSRSSRRGSILGLFLPASRKPPSGAYAYSAGTPLLDELTYEIAAGVQSEKENPTILLAAYSSMDSAMDTPAVRKVLATCISGSDPGFKAAGLAGNLSRAVPGAIQQLIDLWPTIRADSHADGVVSALRNSWRDSTPASVQQLASFAATLPAGSKIREAAVRALAAVHTKEALPFLASLLSSKDGGEQERAVYGISAFANGCPMQTTANVISMAYLQCNQASAYRTADTTAHFAFRPGTPEQEAPFIFYWQDWWDNHPELH